MSAFKLKKSQVSVLGSQINLKHLILSVSSGNMNKETKVDTFYGLMEGILFLKCQTVMVRKHLSSMRLLSRQNWSVAIATIMKTLHLHRKQQIYCKTYPGIMSQSQRESFILHLALLKEKFLFNKKVMKETIRKNGQFQNYYSKNKPTMLCGTKKNETCSESETACS